jgi:hypothetical protein
MVRDALLIEHLLIIAYRDRHCRTVRTEQSNVFRLDRGV